MTLRVKKPVPLVNTKIAGKWTFIQPKLIIIGFDSSPHIYIAYSYSGYKPAEKNEGYHLVYDIRGYKQWPRFLSIVLDVLF